MKKNSTINKILRYSKKIKGIKLLGNKCEICGNENIYHLIFHHNNNDKDFEISDKKNMRWSLLEKEIKKCRLLCENCHRELHYNETNGDKRRNDKIIYLDYKDNKCEKCGYDNCNASLTFHHKDPEIKEFTIGSLSERMNSVNDLNNIIKKELDKCNLLCMNCHREEHFDIEFFEKYKSEIYEKSEKLKEKKPKLDRNIVFDMFENGIKQIDIAKHFGYSKSTISDILRGRTENDKFFIKNRIDK